ncbi:MAG: GWxTD domain-containing protein [Gemmatimonadaceae bacterium]|nr:GWxTD domain-containing protein [Gemmatimonadaceae bacterium]
MPIFLRRTHAPLRPLIAAAMMAALAACGGKSAAPGGAPAPRTQGIANRPTSAGPEYDASRLYTQMGFLAAGPAVPFVGAISYRASASIDSTDVTIGLSLANAALSFARDNDRFVAGYSVTLTIRQGGLIARDISTHEVVRVSSYKETSRLDESVVFQQGLLLPPGQYALAATIKDDGSGRSSSQEMTFTVPRLGAPGTLSTPVPYLQAVVRRSKAAVADLVVNPRATVSFGRDSVIGLYVEGYGEGDRLPLSLEVRNDAGRLLYRDTLSLPHRTDLFSGVAYIPVPRIGIGVSVVSIWPTGGADTTRAPVFVTFGEGLPVAKFEDMMQYLRWFASQYRVNQLRNAEPEARAEAWTNFVKATDSSPLTPVNEDLIEYFDRLMNVSSRFREEGTPGWMTDRGKVFLGIGQPDQIYDQGLAGMGTRGRTQVWEYRRLNIQLVFYDQSGFDRWRLTNSSEMEFQAAWQRRVNR